ncbi:hypothetical protein GX48_06548 [Paracoccidioides brasiliensis]|nr:hypothetical protein GX48_06548 [Paracoccidioides brasiliensis]
MDRLFHNIPCLKKIYGILPGSGKWRAHLPVSWRDTILRWHQVDHLFRVLKRPFYASSLQREAPRNRSGHLRFKRGPEADQTDVNTDELLRVFEEDSDVTGSAFFDEDDVSWTMKENPVSQTTASQMPPTYSSLRLIPNISLNPA